LSALIVIYLVEIIEFYRKKLIFESEFGIVTNDFDLFASTFNHGEIKRNVLSLTNGVGFTRCR
jgi:hypothetical protein